MKMQLFYLCLFWSAGIVGCGDREAVSPSVAKVADEKGGRASESDASSESRPVDTSSDADASSTDSFLQSSGDSSGSFNRTTATTHRNRPAAEQQAIDEIRKLNGKIEYLDTSPASPVISVRFNGQRRLRGSDLGILKDLPTIRELDLDGTSVTDVSLITGLPQLRILDLPDLAPDQFAKLAELPSLMTLSVGIDKPSLESAGIDNRFKNREATNAFTSQDFVGQALGNLSKSQALRHLRVTQGGSATLGGGWLKAESFAPIQRFPSLTFLDFQPFVTSTSEKADLEVAAYDQIARSSTLDTLIVTHQFRGDCMSRLATSQSLKRLAIALPPRNGDGIVRTAATIPSLTKLNITSGGQTVSDTLLLQLKRERPGLLIEMKKANWWDDCVAESRTASVSIPIAATPSGSGIAPTPSVSASPSIPSLNKPPITSPPQIDLLKDIDFPTQAVDGNVSVTGNGLQVSNRISGKKWPRAMLPRRIGIGDSYTLRCSFTHVKGPCGIVFPVGDHNTFLMLGGWDGATSGIQMIDGKYGDYNSTTVRNNRIADNGTHKIELDVAQSGDAVKITVTLDDKPFTSYQGSAKSLSLHQEVTLPDKQVIGLVAGSEAVFHTATLQVASAIAGKWNNLTSEGWVLELLENGDAHNINLQGVAVARGAWQDDGKGTFTIRFENGRVWKGTLTGDSMAVDVLLDGKLHSKGSFSRKPGTQQESPRTVAEALKMLEGEWQCIAGEEQGKVQQDSQVKQENRRLRISGNSLTMERSNGNYIGRFEIGSPEKRTFDWVGKGPKGFDTAWMGIYDISDDTLRLCVVFQSDERTMRPTDFRSTASSIPGQAQAFYTFKRVTSDPSKIAAIPTAADALALLQGEWQCIAGEENGKGQQDSQVQQENRRLRISRNSLTMERTGGTWTGKFEIGSPKEKTFDWIGKNTNGDLTEWIGIYEVIDDTLRLCIVWQRDGKSTRPTDFRTTAPTAPGLAQAYYTFKRVVK